MVGVVAIDVPAPEATLTTLTPIGAHLVVHLRTAQAAELYERLRRLLEPQGRVVTGDDFADMSMRELIDVDGGDRVSVRRGERKTLLIDPGHTRRIEDTTLGRAASQVLTGQTVPPHNPLCAPAIRRGGLCWHLAVEILQAAGPGAWSDRGGDS
jgi:hypothetical protein